MDNHNTIIDDIIVDNKAVCTQEFLSVSLLPLVQIANAYDANELDDGARKFWGSDNQNENTTNPEDIVLYSGRGGKALLTLADALNARDVLRNDGDIEAAMEPLVNIARAFDANELDDGARKFWGSRLQTRNQTPHVDVELYAGRGGRTLLNLEQVLDARIRRNEVRHARRAA